MWRRIPSGLAAAISLMIASTLAQAQGTSSAGEVDEATIARFRTILEKNPRRGTAFDKVYGYHLEHGSLPELLNDYTNQVATKSGAEAGSAWMIIGLIESRRGHDGRACEAFQKVEAADTSNSLAPYYLGQTLTHLGQSEKAAEAFERAIERMPTQSDLLEIFQALGRVYQRRRKTDKALEVWNRLEQHFPDDVRVQEQVASLLLEENDFAGALPRFENLIRTTKDKYHQSLFRIEVAAIKLHLDRTDEALRDFEQLKGQLNPDNWLFRDVRRRIEGVFLRKDDQDGLVKYYESWLRNHPDDLDAMSRLAGFLVGLDRATDARPWLETGLRLAPSKKELRRTLINLLLYENKYADAAAQYEQLDKYEPNNSDTLRNWGRAVMRDTSRGIAERRRQSGLIWRRLLAARPNDPVVVLQTAELFRHTEITDEALLLYRRAIELAPDTIQYREYLGEYLHSLQRKDDALAAWREIATGSRHTASNTSRLAEVLANVGHLDEAVEMNAEACRLDPRDFSLRLKRVDLLSRTDRHDAALQTLAEIENLPANDEERESWLQRELTELKMAGRLSSRITEVRKQLESEPRQGEESKLAATAIESRKLRESGRWYWLARAGEVDGQLNVTLSAIARAVELAPQSVPILTASARIYEARHKLRAAVDTNRKLAALEPRFRTEYLKRVVILEQKLGRRDEALQAGQELLATAPGNPDVCEFYSQLCFQLGQTEAGLIALRSSLRANPGDVRALMKLASILVERRQPAEAIELLWLAFERAKNLDERLSVVEKLTTAHMKSEQTERLMARLEREGRDPAHHRDWTVCLAQVHETRGDLAAAQRALESLLTDETRDVPLLVKLRSLAERRSQFPAAIRVQRQIWRITNDPADRLRLSQLLVAAGGAEEAEDLLSSLNESLELTAEVLSLLDTMYARGQTKMMLTRLQLLSERHPDNWELQYRQGMALAASTPLEAIRHFESILAVRRPDDERSLVRSVANPATNSITPTRLPLIEQMSQIAIIQQAMQFRPESAARRAAIQAQMARQTGIQPGGPSRTIWMPLDYGTARLAAWGWLLSITSNRRGMMEGFVDERLVELDQSATRESLIDRIAIYTFLYDVHERFAAVQQLARRSEDDMEAGIFYLMSFGKQRTTSITGGSAGEVRRGLRIPSLSTEELSEAVEIYQRICDRRELIPWNVTVLGGLIYELQQGGQSELASRMLNAGIDKVTTREEVACYFCDAIVLDTHQSSQLLGYLIDFETNPPVSQSSSGTAATISRELSPENIAQHLAKAFQRPDQRSKELLEAWACFLKFHSTVPDNTPPQQISFRQSSRQTITNRGVSKTNGGRLADFVVIEGSVIAQRESQFNTFHHQAGGFCPSATYLLLFLISRYAESGDLDGLITEFQRRTMSTDQSDNERLMWEHGLAYLLWAEGRNEAALTVLSNVVNRHPERTDMRFTLAAQYEAAEQPEKALSTLDSVPETTPDLQMEREQMALRLATTLNNKDRARKATQRLSGLKVAPENVLPLAETAVQLGLVAEAEALLDREPKQGRDLRHLTTLMELRLARGDLEQAATEAELILAMISQLVRDPNGGLFRSPTQVVNGVMETEVEARKYRNAALKVLKETGKLSKLIEKLEANLARTPEKIELINDLVLYHNFMGNVERVNVLTQRQMEIHLHKPDMRYAYIVKQLDAGKIDEAVDQMKILVEKHPAYAASRCNNALIRFENKNGLQKLAVILEHANWSPVDDSLETTSVVIEKFAEIDSTKEIGKRMFVNEWKARKGQQVELLLRIPSESLRNLPEIADSMRQLPIPTDSSQISGQWMLFGREWVESEDGSIISTALGQLLNRVARRGELDLMATEVEQGLKQYPDWIAGKVLLGLIDLRRKRVEEGRNLLQGALPNLQTEMQNRPRVAWEIADQLNQHESCQDVAMQYYELSTRGRGWLTTSSPLKMLVKSLAKRDRVQDARRLLLQALPPAVHPGSKGEGEISSGELYSAQGIGAELLALQFPVDAIDVYATALGRSENVKFGGYDPRVVMQSNIIAAFKKLTAEQFVRSLEVRDDEADLNVHPFVPQHADSAHMETRWHVMLSEVAADEELAKRVRAALTAIRDRRPKQIGAIILAALLALKANDQDQFRDLARTLAEEIREQESIKQTAPEPGPNGSPTAKDRTSSSNQIALWLVARECLRTPALPTIGETLGKHALEASQSSQRLHEAIVAEWIQIANQTGDLQTVERLKTELDKSQLPEQTERNDRRR